jgi:hypothetical protein
LVEQPVDDRVSRDYPRSLIGIALSLVARDERSHAPGRSISKTFASRTSDDRSL